MGICLTGSAYAHWECTQFIQGDTWGQQFCKPFQQPWKYIRDKRSLLTSIPTFGTRPDAQLIFWMGDYEFLIVWLDYNFMVIKPF